jgi:hypothetical protein
MFLTELEHKFHPGHTRRKEEIRGRGGQTKKKQLPRHGFALGDQTTGQLLAAQFRVEKQHPVNLPADGGH